MSPSAAFRVALASSVACAVSRPLLADDHVVVSARANAAYAQRKFDGAEVKMESYVFGEGSFFGGITRDRSLERMPFRRIAESLAPELARQQFWPAKDLATADLLIVVHWGVTTPHQSFREAQDITTLSFDPRDTPQIEHEVSDQMFKNTWADSGETSTSEKPVTQDSLHSWQVAPALETVKQFSDEAARNFRQASNAQLLGYTKTLRDLGNKAFGSAEEAVLRADLSTERYVIILCAYDLKTPVPPGQKRRPVWVTHVNVRAPGTNFPLAVERLGHVGANFFGRNTDAPTTLRATMREGRATPGPLIILGIEEPKVKPPGK